MTTASPANLRRRIQRRVAGHGSDQGAVAVLVSIVFLFVILPLIAGVTSVYIKSGAASELQDSSDQGALAGAALIPLLSPSQAVTYLNEATDQAAADYLNGIIATENLDNDSDPIAVATAECNEQANDESSLGASFSNHTPATCSASYLGDNSLLGSVTSCLTSAESTVTTVTNDVPLVSQLPVSAALATAEAQLSPIITGLANITPMLAHPGVMVTTKRQIQGPFDGAIGQAPQTADKVSFARQQIKNLIVLPEVNLPADLSVNGDGVNVGGGVDVSLNANPTAQQLKDAVDQILTDYASDIPRFTNNTVNNLNNALSSVLGLIPGTSSLTSTVTGLTDSLNTTAQACEGILTGLRDDLDQLIDPPAYGPDTLAMVNSLTDGEPLTIVKIGTSLGVPFLDVTTCTKGQDLVSDVEQLTSLANLTQQATDTVNGVLPTPTPTAALSAHARTAPQGLVPSVVPSVIATASSIVSALPSTVASLVPTVQASASGTVTLPTAIAAPSVSASPILSAIPTALPTALPSAVTTLLPTGVPTVSTTPPPDTNALNCTVNTTGGERSVLAGS